MRTRGEADIVLSDRSDLGEPQTGLNDGQQKRIPGTVVTIPFYDPEKTRVRS